METGHRCRRGHTVESIGPRLEALEPRVLLAGDTSVSLANSQIAGGLTVNSADGNLFLVAPKCKNFEKVT